MSGVTILHNPKKDLSSDEISAIVIDELVTLKYATKQKLQDYVRAHMMRAFSQAIDFRAKSIELLLEDKSSYPFKDDLKKYKEPGKWEEEIFLRIANHLNTSNPYQDIKSREWKEDSSLRLSHVRRVMDGKEPILSRFLYWMKNEISRVVDNTCAHLSLMHTRYSIDKSKVEEVLNQHADILKQNFNSQLKFFPVKRNIPNEKYFELYRKITGKEPPFPEEASAMILCGICLVNYGLGIEKERKLLFNKSSKN